MEKLEKELLKAIALEVSLLRIGLPILVAVLALQVYALVQGVIVL
ncbi:MAG: hypothetical protein WCO66_04620 [Candidatus Absconditabacteria bacterium]